MMNVVQIRSIIEIPLRFNCAMHHAQGYFTSYDSLMVGRRKATGSGEGGLGHVACNNGYAMGR